MIYFLLIALGFVGGIVFAFGFLGLKPAKTEATTPQPEPEAPAESPAAPSEPALPEPLSTRLHRLGQPLETFGDNSAHPRELADRSEFSEAVALLSAGEVSFDTVLQYALGANWTLSCAAMTALSQREDGEQASQQIASSFGRMRPWAMHFALEYLTSLKQRPPAGAPAVPAESWWNDNVIIPGLFRSYFTRLQDLGDLAVFGTYATASFASEPAEIESFLKSLEHPFASALILALKDTQSARIDTSYLESFGRFWAKASDLDVLLEPEEWKDLLAAAENALGRAPARSLLVHGDPKTGKSSFLKLLGNRLMRKGWTIFEAGGPDLQAGQAYIGQLEERVRRMTAELSANKHALWYVPDILQIAVSGTHHGQSASILDQVLPAITAGRLIILSEATPTQATQLVQLRPKLKDAFEVVPLTAMTEVRAAAFVQSYLERLTHKTRVTFEPGSAQLAMQLARQYLGTSQLPGAVLDLLKLSFNRAVGEGEKTITTGGILRTLSQVTGLPVAILDGKEKVELAAVNKFFGERVMGQAEAVGTVVDRIAMLKAGLTDPGKPIGVFLFAGPTGTGKTELAKTLAEFLFGSGERMIRLDMSEFKTQESLNKIIGDPGGGPSAESLINRVRKQPFSVVLLDEFEKAHVNVWDLFLQVFDDGRLSDAAGNVADFRHCIIILTSNLGATAHQSSGLGFGAKTDAFSSDQIANAIRQAFRPEFINRLDSVIVFQPLKRELMKQILQKELRQVLERRGLRNREWAVEWESSALEFLLDKGFSPELGARPLKRAIDQYLLAPLAATIVEHRFPEGDQFLFVRSDGKGVQVEFVDPDADASAPSGASAMGSGLPRLEEIIMQASGSNDERAAIEAAFRALKERLEGTIWSDLALQLSREIGDPAIWSRTDRYGVLARYALIDRVKAAFKTTEALRERLDKSRDARGYSRELIGRLARQIYVTMAGVEDALADAPVESVVSVDVALESSRETPEARAWCNQILAMYKSWAVKRGMQVSEFPAAEGGGATLLTISGFGAHRGLSAEIGLHVLEAPEGENEAERLIARVRMAAAPLGDLPAATAAKVLRNALDAAPVSNAVTRRYRGGPSPLVRDAKRGWRSGKFAAILSGDFDVVGEVAAR
ncbi:MAG: AAA family ATPase [Alphaproteobacteria bacterium]|nr:AAA family ATPase [Alphaproteobacteria bacterium]